MDVLLKPHQRIQGSKLKDLKRTMNQTSINVFSYDEGPKAKPDCDSRAGSVSRGRSCNPQQKDNLLKRSESMNSNPAGLTSDLVRSRTVSKLTFSDHKLQKSHIFTPKVPRPPVLSTLQLSQSEVGNPFAINAATPNANRGRNDGVVVNSFLSRTLKADQMGGKM